MFIEEPKFFIQLANATKPLLSGKDLYDWQLSHLGSALIIEDYDAPVEINSGEAKFKTDFIFPKDSLISGSYAMHLGAKNIQCGTSTIKHDDIDIYFKTKEDAQEFLKLNTSQGPIDGFAFENHICTYGYINLHKINLIYGVEYENPGHLISRFDIRACSMAIDVNASMFYVVRGALEDATKKQLVFNPVPRGVSVRRFAKYIEKGFKTEKYQNLFFVELLKSSCYKPELELLTKEY